MNTRVVLVTAGAQGLGAAISRHLLARGDTVLVHYASSRAAAEALVDEANTLGGQAHALQGDLATVRGREDFSREVKKILDQRGLDLLVNNLGVFPTQHLLEMTIETFEQTFALTCTSVFHLTQLMLPVLRKAKPPARIINIGDANCDRIEAHDDAPAYHIAKLGVHVLTRTYAQQLGPEGITVNMLSPGFLENSVGEPDHPIPLGRLGRFDDILGGLDYLLSDAASYVTGTNLRISGGFNL